MCFRRLWLWCSGVLDDTSQGACVSRNRPSELWSPPRGSVDPARERGRGRRDLGAHSVTSIERPRLGVPVQGNREGFACPAPLAAPLAAPPTAPLAACAACRLASMRVPKVAAGSRPLPHRLNSVCGAAFFVSTFLPGQLDDSPSLPRRSRSARYRWNIFYTLFSLTTPYLTLSVSCLLSPAARPARPPWRPFCHARSLLCLPSAPPALPVSAVLVHSLRHRRREGRQVDPVAAPWAPAQGHLVNV